MMMGGYYFAFPRLLRERGASEAECEAKERRA